MYLFVFFFASRKLAKRNKNLFEFLLATWRIYWGYRTGMWPHPSQNPFSFSKYKQVHENRYLHYVYLTRRANHFIIAIFLKKKSSRGFPGNLLRRFSHLEKTKIKFCSKSCWRFFPNNARFDPSAKRPRKPASVDIVKPSFRHFDCFFYFLSRQQKTLSVTKWETVLLRKKRIISSLQIQFFISSETGP